MAAAAAGSSGEGSIPKLRPNGGMEIWELGVQKNWGHLATLLEESGAESWFAGVPSMEDRLSQVRCEIDASESQEDSRGLVFGLACGDGSHRLLKRVLALGAHPDLPASTGERPSHMASFYMRVACVEALSLCRPDLSAKAAGGQTPLDYAKLALPPPGVAEKRMAKNRIKEVWEGMAKYGFPNIAQLAYQMDFWAVQNLCRRRVVPKSEVLELYKGKDVFQWAEHHGERNLVKEMRYLLRFPDAPSQPSEAKPTVEALSKKKVDVGAAAPPVESNAVPACVESKEFQEMKKILVRTVNATVEEKLAKMRSGGGDEEDVISRRLEKFRKEQDAKTEELQLAFSELAAELHSLGEKFDAGSPVEDDDLSCGSETDGLFEKLKDAMKDFQLKTEEKLAEMRASSSVDLEELISRRLEAFQKDQDVKTDKLAVAVSDLADEFHSWKKSFVDTSKISDDGSGRRKSTELRTSTSNNDPLRLVFSGLLAKIDSIAASGVSHDLVDDLLALVKKHDTGDQNWNRGDDASRELQEEERCGTEAKLEADAAHGLGDSNSLGMSFEPGSPEEMPGNAASPNADGMKVRRRGRKKKTKSEGAHGCDDLDSVEAPFVAHVSQSQHRAAEKSPASEHRAQPRESERKDEDGQLENSSQRVNFPIPRVMSSPVPASAPAAADTSDPAAPHLRRPSYVEGQYRPDFPQGRRVYDHRFMLALKECPHAMRYPRHLIKEKYECVRDWSGYSNVRRPMNVPYGDQGRVAFDFIPWYAKTRGGGGGPKRKSVSRGSDSITSGQPARVDVRRGEEEADTATSERNPTGSIPGFVSPPAPAPAAANVADPAEVPATAPSQAASSAPLTAPRSSRITSVQPRVDECGGEDALEEADVAALKLPSTRVAPSISDGATSYRVLPTTEAETELQRPAECNLL